MVQPAKHPNTPPAQKVSKSGNEVWQAYLPFANGVKCIRDSLQVPESDSLVLVASPAGSIEARDYTSNGIHQTRPEFTVIDPAGQWKTSLTWAFYTPSRPANTVYPFVLHDKLEWESAPHAFQHVDEKIPIESLQVPLELQNQAALLSLSVNRALHIYTHDYLLVTVLPRYAAARSTKIDDGFSDLLFLNAFKSIQPANLGR